MSRRASPDDETSQDQTPCRGGLAFWQRRQAERMLASNLAEPPRIDAVARACKLSTSHFRRAFCQSVGSPPRRWLMERRIERAEKMLTDSSLPLAEIAVICGFFDQSHFSRAFAAARGTPPGRYRRAICADAR